MGFPQTAVVAIASSLYLYLCTGRLTAENGAITLCKSEILTQASLLQMEALPDA